MKYSALLVIFVTLPLFAKFDVQDRILAQEVLYDNYEAVFGDSKYARIDEFKKHVRSLKRSKKKSVSKYLMALQDKVPVKFLMPMVYWKVIDPNNEKLRQVFKLFMSYRLNVLRDVIDDPLETKDKKVRALALLRTILNSQVVTSNNISTQSKGPIKRASSRLANAQGRSSFINGVLSEPLISTPISHVETKSLSWLGYIPGNKVEHISKNDVSVMRIEWINENVIFNNLNRGIEWDKPHFKMPESVSAIGNPVFKDPVFARIRDMVRDAKESIFIDIFLFGGTMGATLSKYIVEKTISENKKNNKFKTLILHDFATNYNMKPEMMPIFNYLRDEIKGNEYLKSCQCLILLQANIQRHTPGVPFGLSNLVPKTKEAFEMIEQKNTYYESKIDHSKVIVVDAKSDRPKAYFGSKNWSDHSGAYYYDDVMYVEGPGAALVQSSYYYDVEAALTTDAFEKSRFFFRSQGFSNDHYLARSSEILDFMKIKRKYYPAVGNQVVRFAESNVDGTVKNVRNMIINMIEKAESYIYMEQLFIYDKYINDALIKKRKTHPKVEIRILADHNGNFEMNGFPNTMFIAELQAVEVNVRAWRTEHSEATFPDGTKRMYHQENHRKISSVDGKIMMVGSSNMNPDTFQGSFREFGAQVYDTVEIEKFESRFKSAWSDSDKTEKFVVKNMKVKGHEFSKELTELFNSFIRQLVRIKDDLEKRH